MMFFISATFVANIYRLDSMTSAKSIDYSKQLFEALTQSDPLPLPIRDVSGNLFSKSRKVLQNARSSGIKLEKCRRSM